MSVGEARKILGKINFEIDGMQMEDIIQFLYQLAQIEYEGFITKSEREALERKNQLK